MSLSSEKLEHLRKKLAAKQAEFVLSKSPQAPNGCPEQLLASRKCTGADDAFMELRAGKAELMLAVKRAVGGSVEAILYLTQATAFKDLKKKIKSRKVRWIHLAPPYRTFTKVRRKDRYTKCRKLRSRKQPGGLEPKTRSVREANLVASRAAQLALLQWKAGGAFSLESPAGSLLWEYKPVKQLASLKHVLLLFGDQCCFNGERVRPTGCLTNASFLQTLERKCPGAPLHHHSPFEAPAASEYPQGLCEHLAACYKKFLGDHLQRGEPWQLQWTLDGDTNALFSKRVRIEQQNDEAIAGLRNPAKAQKILPQWPPVGREVRSTIEATLQRCSDLFDLRQYVGSDETPDLEAGLTLLQAALHRKFGFGSKAPGLWGGALERLVTLTSDPDTETATWPRLGTPLGIVEPIRPSNIFPLLADDDVEHAAPYEDLALEGAWANYKSYDENREEAEALFDIELEKGFVEWSPNLASLEAKYGRLIPSAIGVVVKQKPGAKKKVRLVHDLRRSLVNEQIACPERLILPRLRDVVSDILDLLECKEQHEHVLLVTLDFSDAFKHLQVRDSEKRFLAGQAKGGFFVYNTVLFGVKTGPLVWGRMAALLSRSTQALFSDRCYRLQTFVDDPIIVVKGTEEEIHNMINTTLAWWSVVGLRIAWSKGGIGHSAEWIGANITINNEGDKVVVQVPADKINDWKVLVDSLFTKPLVSRKKWQQLAGKLNWAAGFVLQLKPFVRMLHAALAKADSSAAQTNFVYFRQVEPALTWISKFFAGFMHGLTWEVRAHWRHTCSLDVLVDASPWGGGAIKIDTDGTPISTISLKWTRRDEELTGAKIGDAGSQALWEGYMMLRSLQCWMTAAMQGFVRVRGDAQGVLASLIKRSANAPLLNRVVREIALHLALNFTSLEALHVWSEDNVWADQLSRGECPPELRSVPQVVDPPNLWRFE